MRARQAKKIAKIVQRMPVNEMPPRWLDRAINYVTNLKRDTTIAAAERYYWKGADKKFKKR